MTAARGAPADAGQTRCCDRCEQPYSVAEPGQRYCSDRCRNKVEAVLQQQRARRKSVKP